MMHAPVQLAPWSPSPQVALCERDLFRPSTADINLLAQELFF